jgi:hypothetical protein
VLPKIFKLAILASMPALASAQQPQPATPPVKVNVLNVCTPSADEQKEIASALSKVPKQARFAPDFEVARGRSSLDEKANIMEAAPAASTAADPITAAWVRIRREFPAPGQFSTVQYSFSADSKDMIETLVLHARDPKELVVLSIEDSASAVTSPASMLGTNTPVDRIKLERFGKPSVVLARCNASPAGPAPDQSAYEPLFHDASAILGRYRELLGAHRMVPEELAKVVTSAKSKATAKSSPGTKSDAKKPAAEKTPAPDK